MTATDLDLDALLDALTARAIERAQTVELVNVAGQPVGPDLRASTGRLQVNPGDIIASVWGNTTYDQTVQAYDTTAARDSQWPTPKDGAVAYSADTIGAWLRRAGAWKGLPLGVIASTTGPASQTDCGATAVTLASLSWPCVAGRRYRTTSYATAAQQTTAGISRANLQDGLGISAYLFYSSNLAPAAIIAGTSFTSAVASTTATVTTTVVGVTSAGTLRFGANIVTILVEDLGTP